jgi:hypothetical protein
MTEPLEAGLFSVDVKSRRVRGILVPWNEMSRVSSTKNKPVKFPPGHVRVPRDISIVGLNRQHDRYDPFGRAVKLDTSHEVGLYAEFAIADTEEGDAWLADHGDLVRLSPELRDIIRDADGETATATLTGAALVDAGAFASAGLFAVDEDDETDGDEAVELEDTDAASAVEDEEPAAEPDEEKEDAVAEASATEVMLGGQGKTTVNKEERGAFASKGAFFRLMDDIMGGRAAYEDRQRVARELSGEAGMFALSDVDYDGTGGVGAKMTPTQWIGEVPTLSYVPVWSDLFPSETLASLSLGGWKWGTKPTGGTWTGNKDAIPSNTPTVTPVTESATRWAGGHDIAREHRDFGTPGFFESYNAAMRNSFEQWLDVTIVRTELLAGATDIEADDPTGLTIGAGWSALIDGAAQVIANGYVPTFAQIELSLWKSMMKVPSSDTIGYLEAALNLESGTLSGFSFRPVTGITTGHIIVGSRSAAAVYTLPGSPIRAEALNIANGGIDVGFFGYGGLLIRDAAAVVDVAPYSA